MKAVACFVAELFNLAHILKPSSFQPKNAAMMFECCSERAKNREGKNISSIILQLLDVLVYVSYGSCRIPSG